MKRPVTFLTALAALFLAVPAMAEEDPGMLIIAHRGASGERPEHTLAAYDRALEQGADYIEPDLVATRDGVLVARHENEISGTTDVAERAEFAARRTTKVIDGEAVTGWFTEDFALAELRTLRARERLPEVRRTNTNFNDLYQVPTLAEVIRLVQARSAEQGRIIGLYPEIKHPAYFAGIGHDLAAMLVEELAAHGYSRADDAVFIQCFEVAPLVRLATMTDLRLVQLMSAQGGPADQPGLTYADMRTPQGLADVARYADGVGAELALLLQADGAPAPLVGAAQAAGLQVHGWTVRKENMFLPPPLRSSSVPADRGDMAGLLNMLSRAGVDGIFTDDPAIAVAWRDQAGR